MYDISGTRPTETSFYQLFACASAHTCSQFGSLSLSRHVYVCIYTMYIIHITQLSWYDIKASACAAPCTWIHRVFSVPFSNQYPAASTLLSSSVFYIMYKTNIHGHAHINGRHAYHKRAILFLKSKVAAASASIYHKVYPPARIYPYTLIYECVYVACTLHFSFFRWNLWYGEIIHTLHSHMDVRALSQASRRILEMCLRITQQCIRTQHTHTQTHSANSFTQRESI